MATPNYSYEKRQRELAKKRKKEEKLKRKSDRPDAPSEPQAPEANTGTGENAPGGSDTPPSQP
ncbi:hypothetical protein [Caldimonas brevitalea]|uniref:Uncharacterized protein n=1 Tax=Caldimonas brevitalea TaxID=413882 RepID=A0A0G3BXG3_9BURK|nr:hypothetical protein [Caldimonas brevitalea]AKJ31220.1 hypothetical protein AAW51_4529 [Caldimonas brevitalea]